MRVLRASSAWRLCVGLIVSGLVILWNGTIVIEGRRLVTVPVSTDAQLQAAVKAATHGTTIVLAAGTYTLSSTLWLVSKNDITIRGGTGRASDVVLVGRGMSNATYGAVPHGIWSSGLRTTIADLTIRDVYHHPIIFNAGAEQPRVSNVRLVNAGTQFIKSNPDPSGGGVDSGIVENSVFEYTTTGSSGISSSATGASDIWITSRSMATG